MGRMLSPRAPLFVDLDGVILDPSRRYFELHREIFEELGGRCPPLAELWRRKRQGASSSSLCDLDAAGDFDPLAFERSWHERVEQAAYLDLDTIVPGASERLSGWRKQRHSLSLVTLRRNRVTLGGQLERLRLLQLFDELLAAGTPACEEPVAAKVRLIRSSPYFSANAVVIGDTEVDIRAGRQLGLMTIAVAGGLREPQLLAAENPDCLVADLTEIGG